MSGTYDKWNTRGLWKMVADEDPADTEKHLSAWQEKHDLLRDKLTLLRDLRDQLTRSWSPAHSPAAQSFLARIDGMMELIDATSAAVLRVKDEYNQVTSIIQEARSALKPLHETYDDHHAAQASDPLAQWVPNSWVPNTPNVLAHYQRGVDAQARKIMEKMDQQIAEATANPAEIQPMAHLDKGVGLPVPGSSGSNSSGGSASGAGFGPGLIPRPFNPPAAVGVTGSTPGAIGDSPVLAGTPVETTLIEFPSRSSVPPVLSAPPVLPPIAASFTVPYPTAGGTSPRGDTSPPNSLLRQSTMRSGGGIGEPESRPFSAPIARAALPADGVLRGGSAPPAGLGGQGKAAGSAGANGRIPVDQRTSTGGWRDHSYEAYTRRCNDRKGGPDNQWTVADGVAPLLEAPSLADQHDATPGVIGLDR
ncbi:hypothetical protein [Dactylosporangium sp. NPDC051484]|uniref:hypothetical protein n=1 Tax=Dactylosporangium sp. NPDC051484 TaxID=3154942 RepID=UPI00344FF251